MTRVVLDAKTRTIKNVQCHNRPYGNCSLLEAAIKIYDMNTISFRRSCPSKRCP